MSDIKFVKLHSAYFACMTCETEGVYISNSNKQGGRMTFPEIDSTLRTDESFRLQTQPQHHNGRSILEMLPISMILNFAIDVMHFVFIGVMRKLLHIWFHCRKGIRVLLTKASITSVSNTLNQIKNCIPSEFSRKTRGLNKLPRFKATELRLLLLYVLPVLVINLPEEIYNQFLLLYCAIRILCSPHFVSRHDHPFNRLIIF